VRIVAPREVDFGVVGDLTTVLPQATEAIIKAKS